MAKTVGLLSYSSEYSQSRNYHIAAKQRDENVKSGLWGFWASAREGLSPAFSPQPCVKCFSLGSIKRQGCLPVPDVTSHSSILHTLLSIFLLICTPFKSRGLTTPAPSQAGTQTRLMNNRRKDAARLLRENEWRCMSCVEDLSEWELDQSSTCCWHSVEGKK